MIKNLRRGRRSNKWKNYRLRLVCVTAVKPVNQRKAKTAPYKKVFLESTRPRLQCVLVCMCLAAMVMPQNTPEQDR